jgi:hypothetical protein
MIALMQSSDLSRMPDPEFVAPCVEEAFKWGLLWPGRLFVGTSMDSLIRLREGASVVIFSGIDKQRHRAKMRSLGNMQRLARQHILC